MPLPSSDDALEIDPNDDIALCTDLPLPFIPLNDTFFTSNTPTFAANVPFGDNDVAAVSPASICHAHRESQTQHQLQLQSHSKPQFQPHTQSQQGSQSQPTRQLQSELTPQLQSEQKAKPQEQPLPQAQAQSQCQPQAKLKLKAVQQPHPKSKPKRGPFVPIATVEHTWTPPIENRCSSKSPSTPLTPKSDPKVAFASRIATVIQTAVKTEMVVQPQAQPSQPNLKVMANTRPTAAVVPAQKVVDPPTLNAQLQRDTDSVQIAADACVQLSHLYMAQRQELRDARERISELEAQLKQLRVENEGFRSQLPRKRACKTANSEDICATPLLDIDSQNGFVEMDTTGNLASTMTEKTEAVAVPIPASSVTVRPCLNRDAVTTHLRPQIHAQRHVHAPAQRYIQAKPPSNSSVH